MSPGNANYRLYGLPPYKLVLVHGGPGAIGSLASLAEQIPARHSLIEAFQTRCTINQLLEELCSIVLLKAEKPVTIIGHSWGAWLSIMLSCRYPDLVQKLILVASAPLEDRYVPEIMEARLKRMDNEKKHRLAVLMNKTGLPENITVKAIFGEIAKIIKATDSFAPSENYNDGVNLDYRLYKSVWSEAEKTRSSGELLSMVSKVRCPVLAIHGDYDPHPADGVLIPLQERIRDFRFFLLKKCGHEPWNEKFARDRFFELLEKEL